MYESISSMVLQQLVMQQQWRSEPALMGAGSLDASQLLHHHNDHHHHHLHHSLTIISENKLAWSYFITSMTAGSSTFVIWPLFMIRNHDMIRNTTVLRKIVNDFIIIIIIIVVMTIISFQGLALCLTQRNQKRHIVEMRGGVPDAGRRRTNKQWR